MTRVLRSRVVRNASVAVPALALALFVGIHHQGPTVEAASLASTSGDAMASMPGMAGMTASGHIAHIAAMGNTHANHALDGARWAAPGGAAAPPPNLALPPGDMCLGDRLATSPRKG